MKYPLQDEHGERKQKGAAVKNAVFQYFAGSAHCNGKKWDQEVAECGKKGTESAGGKNNKRKQSVRFFRLPFTHDFCHKGAPARTEHESDTGEDHDGGEDQVDRGECRLAHIIRHEKSVDHGVGGNKDHHHHGGQDETEKLFIIETGRNICVHIYFDNLKTKK